MGCSEATEYLQQFCKSPSCRGREADREAAGKAEVCLEGLAGASCARPVCGNADAGCGLGGCSWGEAVMDMCF